VVNNSFTLSYVITVWGS